MLANEALIVYHIYICRGLFLALCHWNGLLISPLHITQWHAIKIHIFIFYLPTPHPHKQK